MGQIHYIKGAKVCIEGGVSYSYVSSVEALSIVVFHGGLVVEALVSSPTVASSSSISNRIIFRPYGGYSTIHYNVI